MDLDHKNKIIIESLMQDCKISIKELSKRTNLTHPAIIYRLKKLEKTYIQKYDALINLSKFNIPFSIILVSVPKKEKAEFEFHFEKNKEISAIIKHTHKYNYSLNGFIVNINEVLKYLQNKKFEYKITTGKKIKDGTFSIFDDVFDELYKNKLQFEKIKKTTSRNLVLDDLDIRLIEILYNGGARKSILELSRDLNENAELVLYRFKRLKKHGYFIKFLAQINFDKFFIRYILMDMKIKKLDFDSVFKIANMTRKLGPFFMFDGKESYFCTLFVKSLDEFEKTLGHIISELDDNLIDFNIYPVKEWLFINRLDLKEILKR